MNNLQEIQGLPFWILLIIVSYIQNMVFTAVSRSRQSANIKMHFAWALASNAVWFFCNFFLLFPVILRTIMEGDLVTKLIVGGVYGISTAFGSVTMMYLMLKKTKGKSQVGAKLYHFHPDDIKYVDGITQHKFQNNFIKSALIKNDGDLTKTLKYLYT